MAKFNYKEITKKMAASPTGLKRVTTIMQRKVDFQTTQLLSDFDTDETTKEIQSKEGDFYGLLGFERESDPIKPVRDVLENDFKLVRTALPTPSGAKKVQYRFSLRVPIEALKKASPLQFEKGKSWLMAVEKEGISGFSQFLSALKEKSGAFKYGYSKRGLQSKGKTGRPDEYPLRPYLFSMINAMVRALKGGR